MASAGTITETANIVPTRRIHRAEIPVAQAFTNPPRNWCSELPKSEPAFQYFVLKKSCQRPDSFAVGLTWHDIDDDSSVVTAFFWKVVVERGEAEIFAEPVRFNRDVALSGL